MTRYWACAALLLALSGCGGGTDTDSPKTKASDSPPSEATEVALKDACPLLEEAWGTEPRLLRQEFIDTVAELEASGDLETRNALASLKQAMEDEILSNSSPVGNGDLNISDNGEERIKSTVRDRCAAVGSSAFS